MQPCVLRGLGGVFCLGRDEVPGSFAVGPRDGHPGAYRRRWVGGDVGRFAPDGCLLHLAAAAAAFDGVGGRRGRRVVQKGQGLFQVGRGQFLEGLAGSRKAWDAPAQPDRFGPRGVGPATAVEEAMNFVDNLAQRWQLRLAAGDPAQGFLLAGGEVALDKQMTTVKEVRDFVFESSLTCEQLAVSPRRPAPAHPGQSGLELPADLGHGFQHRLVLQR